MGTSNSNSGNRGATPLTPSWLSGGNGEISLQQPDNNGEQIATPLPTNSVEPENSSENAQQNLPPIPPVAASNRYRASRSNFSKFVSSGGTNRAHLGGAVSGYIRHSSGGSRTAARNMGSSRKAGARLLGFLTDVVRQGAQEVLRTLSLQSLAQNPIEDIFLALTDYVCPDGGTLDEGIAREAFIQTIVDLAATGITDFNSLDMNQVQTVLEIYISRSIETKLYNEIGNKVIVLSANIQEAENIDSQLHDFIRNNVVDSLNNSRESLESMTTEQIQSFIDNIYEQAFAILASVGNPQEE